MSGVRRTVKRVGVGLLLAVVVLAAVLLVRTVLLPPPPEPGTPPDPPAIEIDAAAERLAQAIRIETISRGREEPVPAADFLQLHQLLQRSFPEVHRTLEREVIGDYSLLYTWRGTDPEAAPIGLLAHLDVVPVPNPDAWQQPAFSGNIADGFIWGRGSLDDKGSVLAILEAAEYLLASGFEPTRTVYLAFGHDEEIGGTRGAKAIAETLAARGVKLDFVLDEGSVVIQGAMPGLAQPLALIGVAEKGYATLQLTAEADGGHSSMPPRDGVIARLARALDRLEHHQMPARLEPPVDAMLTTLAPYMPFGMRLALANQWLFRPILVKIFAGAHNTNALIRTTTALTIAHSGIKENVLPQTGRAVINFRILPGDTAASVVEHVRAVIDDPNVGVDVLEAHDPMPVSSTETAGYRAITAATAAAFPTAAIAPGLVIATTDSHHYAEVARDLYRFEPVHMMPEDLARLHGVDERIGVEQYRQMITFYVRLLQLCSEAV